MLFALLVLTVLVVFAVGVILFLLKRQSNEREKLILLEQNLSWIEQTAFRNYYTRLGQFWRRFGIVYLDGLTYTKKEDVARLFEAGLKSAERGAWDKALTRWEEAKKKAEGTELVALHLLCGGCHFFNRNLEFAEQEFIQALAIARKIKSIGATAASCFLTARIAQEKNEYGRAKRLLKETLHFSRLLKNVELEARAYINLAELLTCEKQPKEALEHHRSALRLLESIGDHRTAVTQYTAIGDLLFSQGELDRARAAYEDGLHLSRQFRNRLGEAEQLTAIGVIHRAQRDYKRSIDTLDRALHIYRDINYLRGQARALYELGLTHERTNSIDIAREFFEQGLVFARRANDRRLISRNLVGLAVNSILHQNYQRARTLIDEAITLDREPGREKELAGDLILSGRLWVLQNEPLKGISQLEQARELSRRHSDIRHEIKALLELTRTYRTTGDRVKARTALEQLLKLTASSEDLTTQADVLTEQGLINYLEGNWQGALRYLTDALNKHQILGDSSAIVEDLYNIGLILQKLNQPALAKERLEQALNLSRQSNNPVPTAKTLLALADSEQSLNNLPLAKQHLIEALELFRAINDQRGEADCLVKLAKFLVPTHPNEARFNLEQALRIYQKLKAEDGIQTTVDMLNKISPSFNTTN
ncbi:MAG: tetratricopeptide repeat protein [candidate division WOR-3 bacterium]|nr:tetratricopeptide repeat protein [candidate division WOR-3 bacterium]